jgi:hypothetical protein
MFLKFLEAAHLVKWKLKTFDKIDLTTCKLNFRLFQFEVKSLFNYEMELKKCCIKLYKVEDELKRNSSNLPALRYNIYRGHHSVFRKLNNEHNYYVLVVVKIIFNFFFKTPDISIHRSHH